MPSPIYVGSSQALITAPGEYVIDRDLTQSNPTADCIIVTPGVHFVTIKLRSRLEGAGGAGSTNAAIRAVGSAAVKVIDEGGEIRGFAYGLSAWDCFLMRVRGLYVRDALFRGIKIEGNEAKVELCTIRNVTGATWTPNAYCMGIEVQGMASGPASNGKPEIVRNDVFNVQGMGTGESVGISVTDKAHHAVVYGNTIKNPAIIVGKSYGLWGGGESDIAATHNLIDTWWKGAVFSSVPTGFIDENAIINCTTMVEGNAAVVGGMDG